MSAWRTPVSGLAMVVVFAYLLTLLPLPGVLIYGKPFWLGLLMIWLALEDPGRGTLGLAFLVGLGADLLLGTWFGEHAFRLLVIAFIVRRFRSRLRFFPIWQQTLAAAALLLNDRIVMLMLRGLDSVTAPGVLYWLPALTGALFWPLLVGVMNDVRHRLRQRRSNPD